MIINVKEICSCRDILEESQRERLVSKSNKVDETKIILTSTWRLGKDKDGKDIPEHYTYLKERLGHHGLEIYDETPSIRYSKDGFKGRRGCEIMTWIYQHRDMDISGMVIIDDVVYEDFKKYALGPYFVKCDYFGKLISKKGLDYGKRRKCRSISGY